MLSIILNSKVNVNNKHSELLNIIKLLFYTFLIKSIWTYDSQLWGNAKISNLNKKYRGFKILHRIKLPILKHICI